jgi:hypothetical protein
MTGLFALVVLALVVLGFLVVGSSLSELMVGDEEVKVAEEEEGEWSCLRLLVAAVESFLLVVGMAFGKMLEMDGREEGAMRVLFCFGVEVEGAMVRKSQRVKNLPSSPAELRNFFLMSWKQARAD